MLSCVEDIVDFLLGSPLPEGCTHLQIARIVGSSQLTAIPFLGELPRSQQDSPHLEMPDRQ